MPDFFKGSPFPKSTDGDKEALKKFFDTTFVSQVKDILTHTLSVRTSKTGFRNCKSSDKL